MSPAYPAFPVANRASRGGSRARPDWTSPPFSGHNDGPCPRGRGPDQRGRLVAVAVAAEFPPGAVLPRNADPGTGGGPKSRYAGTMTGTESFRRTSARGVSIAAALAL